MPLHITKIAFGCDSAADLRARLERRAGEGEVRLTTRYCPKRVAEMAGGSLYWIQGGMIVGRSPILGFEDNGEGRYWLKIEPRLIAVQPRAKRAHQGWRYLEAADAPADLGEGETAGDAIPADMARELGRLGLV
tara:strand:- start:82289 stop:82690 length:402 start_codon:yes stop_codon:yes gene_type:complete